MPKIYLNLDTQQIVDVTGKVVKSQLSIDFATETQIAFQFLDAEQEIVDIESGDYYLAANNFLNDYNTCCFVSQDYVIDENIITFNVDTYNKNFEQKVKDKDTKLFLELGFKAENSTSYSKLFSNEILAQPRVFVDGIAPPPLTLYYTINEVDDLINELNSYIDNFQINSSQNLQTPFNVDFSGQAIQIYSSEEAVSDTLTIANIGFLSSVQPENIDPNLIISVEVLIPASGDISTVIIPTDVISIDIPETLTFDQSYKVTYHSFSARFVQIVVDDQLESSYQLNYRYSFGIGKIEE